MSENSQNNKYLAHKILKDINLSGDIDEVSKYENMLCCIYSAPIMFFTALLNFILRYLIWREDIIWVLSDTFILTCFGILLGILLRVNIKVRLSTFLISLIYCLYYVFLYYRYYTHLGPLIWVIGCLQMILVISHVTKDMALYNGITILALSIYTFIREPQVTLQLNSTYYILLIALMFACISGIIWGNYVHFIRYRILREQLNTVLQQKKEISDLYKEVEIAKEELALQNETLQEYNAKIKQNEEKLLYMANHDTLTGLPNRKLVYETLEQIIEEFQQKNRVAYVVFIDIDYFKNINDSLGHHIGDLFITEVARRLNHLISKEDLIGRTGGDEFTLIISRNITKEEVAQYLHSIQIQFSEDFSIHNNIIHTTASFGVSVFPQDGSDVITLMRKSDVAMYKAKEQGKNKIMFYEPKI